MRSINVTSQEAVLRSIETMINQNTLHMQSVTELSQNATVDTVRNVINQLMVPAIENVRIIISVSLYVLKNSFKYLGLSAALSTTQSNI